MKTSFHLNPSSISQFVELPLNHRLSHTTRDYHRLGSRLLTGAEEVQVETCAVGSRVSSLDCEIEGIALGITCLLYTSPSPRD